MDQLYTYQKNSKINELLIRIEVAKKVIDLLPHLPKIEANLRRQTVLKSSIFSARIEGNTLEPDEYDKQSTQNREKKEVMNIVRALEWIHTPRPPEMITKATIIKLHEFVMSGLSGEIGMFRKEITAIFNRAGIALYMTPPPNYIHSLVQKLVLYIAETTDHPTIIASKSHFVFEKIHPFIDGNGRVGRLLSTLVLKNGGYAMHGLVAIEEYLNEHRGEYYDLLANTNTSITSFIEFFLEAIVVSSEESFNKLKNFKEEKPEDSLLPRRQEILAVIREQRFCSFDMIKRKFTAIPDSSLHYDVQILIRKGFIRKLGTTRGVVYSPY